MSRDIVISAREALIIAAAALFSAGILGASIGRATAPESVSIRDLERHVCSGNPQEWAL